MKELKPEQVAAIENGSHEGDTRVCFQCAHEDEHPHGWRLVEFVGGSHWLCAWCWPDDASIQE